MHVFIKINIKYNFCNDIQIYLDMIIYINLSAYFSTMKN